MMGLQLVRFAGSENRNILYPSLLPSPVWPGVVTPSMAPGPAVSKIIFIKGRLCALGMQGNQSRHVEPIGRSEMFLHSGRP